MKNYGWKSLRLFVGSLAILGFTSACGTTTKTIITTMPLTSTPTIYSHMSFKPDYFSNTPRNEQKHVALFYKITPLGKIVFLGIPPQVRSGPFPFPYDETLGSTTHERTGSGDTKIVYFDASGDEIGHYYIESPDTTRRCAGPLTGSGRKEKKLRPATDPNKPEELLLPYDTNIKSVHIISPTVVYSKPSLTIP